MPRRQCKITKSAGKDTAPSVQTSGEKLTAPGVQISEQPIAPDVQISDEKNTISPVQTAMECPLPSKVTLPPDEPRSETPIETAVDAAPSVADCGRPTSESSSSSSSSRASPLTGQCAPDEPTEAALCPGLSPELDAECVKEEERLQKEGEREAERLRKEAALRADHEQREERYKRLLRLLNTSQFYVKYLVEKIDTQHDQLQKTLAARSAGRGRKRAKPEETEAVRKSARTSNKENETAPPPTKRAARKGRGRRSKAAAEEEQVASSQESQGESQTDSQPESQPEGAQGETAADSNESVQPRLLTGGTLRDYQLEGYHWLKVMFENGVNCILGDEMGLGKTIQCISLIAYLMEQSVVGPYLIIAPLSTLPNWMAEFQRFTPGIPVVLYHGAPEHRHSLLPKIRKFHPVPGCKVPVHPVVLTTYELVIRDSRQLTQFQWRYLIIDEGHRIKNHECRLVRELKRYASVNRLLLTGTPLQNNLAELWSLLNFLLPEIFDDLAVFESWFDVTAMSSDADDDKIVAQERETQVVSTLHKILTPFLLRRVKRDVDLQIPPKRELLVYCPMVKDQAELYESALKRSIAKLIGQRQGEKDPDAPPALDEAGRPKRASKEGVSFEFLFSDGSNVLKDEARWAEGLQRLEEVRAAARPAKKEKKVAVHLPMQSLMTVMRHVVNHPFLVEHPIDPVTKEYLLVPEVVEKSGKLMVLDAMLARLRAAGHKVLIFSQFVMMLDILADFLTLRGYNFSRLDGRDSVAERQERIQEFNSNPEMGVFIVSTRAGGLGINLTGADTVIIYDSDWNPQRDLQAQDRAHRIGQTKPVIVYRLVTGGTIDERIVERAAAKRKLEKLVMHANKFKSGRSAQVNTSLAPLTPEEMLTLLRERQHHRVVRAGGKVFTDEELDELLDRSDMVAAWNGQKAVQKRKEAAGVFKELETVDTVV